MFSVKATPFNSASRQLYGGWTYDGAQTLWEKKRWAEMARKYSSDPAERAQASGVLRAYKLLLRSVTPAEKARIQKQVRAQGLPYWRDVIRPAIGANEKGRLWDIFKAIPAGRTTRDQRRDLSWLARAPFPNQWKMNTEPWYGAPYMQRIPGLVDADMTAGLRSIDDVTLARHAARAAGRGRPRMKIGDVRALARGFGGDFNVVPNFPVVVRRRGRRRAPPVPATSLSDFANVLRVPAASVAPASPVGSNGSMPALSPVDSEDDESDVVISDFSGFSSGPGSMSES